jgi:hypothetical protein
MQCILTEGSSLRRSKYRPSPPLTILHLYALIFGVEVHSQILSLRLPPELLLGVKTWPVTKGLEGSFLTILYK